MKTIKRDRLYHQGAVLVICLLLLIGVTMLSLSSLNTGLMEIMMADSAEARTRAFQQAQSALEVISDPETKNQMFPVSRGVGWTKCTAPRSGITCNQTNLTLPADFDTGKYWVKIARIDPLTASPKRSVETSPDVFRSAHFSVDSRFSNVANRGGRAQVVQGFLMYEMIESQQKVVRDSDITAP